MNTVFCMAMISSSSKFFVNIFNLLFFRSQGAHWLCGDAYKWTFGYIHCALYQTAEIWTRMEPPFHLCGMRRYESEALRKIKSNFNRFDNQLIGIDCRLCFSSRAQWPTKLSWITSWRTSPLRPFISRRASCRLLCWEWAHCSSSSASRLQWHWRSSDGKPLKWRRTRIREELMILNFNRCHVSDTYLCNFATIIW